VIFPVSAATLNTWMDVDADTVNVGVAENETEAIAVDNPDPLTVVHVFVAVHIFNCPVSVRMKYWPTVQVAGSLVPFGLIRVKPLSFVNPVAVVFTFCPQAHVESNSAVIHFPNAVCRILGFLRFCRILYLPPYKTAVGGSAQMEPRVAG
jgi:hypothetical protein